MISLEDIKQMLHHEKIAGYVKKNRKDDIRTGMIYVALAMLIALAINIIDISAKIYFADVFESISPLVAERYSEITAVGDFDADTALLSSIASSIIGFLGGVAGLAATHYAANALGGKAKMGEYFYIGGKFMLAATAVIFVIMMMIIMPFLTCVGAILMILFLLYAVYLFIILASTLYKIDKVKAFAAIAAGWIVDALVSIALFDITSMVTGLDFGMNELMEFSGTEGYTDMGTQ